MHHLTRAQNRPCHKDPQAIADELAVVCDLSMERCDLGVTNFLLLLLFLMHSEYEQLE